MRYFYSIVFLILLCTNLPGQDIHFSQFYASPLTLNPGLTGYSEGSYRIAGIYRNQWRSVTTPYQTYGLSYDMRLLEDKLDKDIFGIGGSLVYDDSGDGNLRYLSLMASSSYHKLLGAEGKHYIGIGIQLGFVQRSLDFNSISFPSQYNGTEFDLTTNNGESFDGSSINNVDFHTGLLWSSNVLEKIGLFNGFSLFHIIQPKQSFINTNNRISSRYTLHGGLKAKVTEHVYVVPNYIFMYQNKAHELNFGAAVEYYFTDANNTIVSLGGWYRVGDAVIFSASAEYRSVRIGISYDVNTTVSGNKGAFEISLVYLGKIDKIQPPVLKPCPRL